MQGGGSESQEECVAIVTLVATVPSGIYGPTSAALLSELSSQTVSEQETEQVEMGQGKRQKFPCVRLKDFVTHAVAMKTPITFRPSLIQSPRFWSNIPHHTLLQVIFLTICFRPGIKLS